MRKFWLAVGCLPIAFGVAVIVGGAAFCHALIAVWEEMWDE